jgi:hypothetical protein
MNTLQIVASILKAHMGLTAEQIWIYNQRRNIPTTSGLFVTVGRVALKVYGNNSTQSGDSVTSGQWCQETIAINMFSKNMDAMERVPEALAALRSPTSVFTQQQHAISIAPIPQSVVDTSEVEGAGMLFRTTITIVVLSAYEQTSTATYFDPDTIQYSLEETEA